MKESDWKKFMTGKVELILITYWDKLESIKAFVLTYVLKSVQLIKS